MISMLGIALGVAALIVVLSVMNGFQKEVRDRMLSVLSHIEVIGAGPLQDWQKTAAEAERNKEVIGAAPYVAAQAMLTRDDAVRGVLLLSCCCCCFCRFVHTYLPGTPISFVQLTRSETVVDLDQTQWGATVRPSALLVHIRSKEPRIFIASHSYLNTSTASTCRERPRRSRQVLAVLVLR